MSKVSITQVYPTTPDELWGRVGDPAKISSWHPAITESPMEGNARKCTLANGAEITEEITERNDEARRYSYRITGGPLPVANYTATLKVEGHAEGAALTWESSFEAAGAPAEEVEAMVRGVYEAGMQALAAG